MQSQLYYPQALRQSRELRQQELRQSQELRQQELGQQEREAAQARGLAADRAQFHQEAIESYKAHAQNRCMTSGAAAGIPPGMRGAGGAPSRQQAIAAVRATGFYDD